MRFDFLCLLNQILKSFDCALTLTSKFAVLQVGLTIELCPPDLVWRNIA